MGTYDLPHGGPRSPSDDMPHPSDLVEKILGILEDADTQQFAADRVALLVEALEDQLTMAQLELLKGASLILDDALLRAELVASLERMVKLPDLIMKDEDPYDNFHTNKCIQEVDEALEQTRALLDRIQTKEVKDETQPETLI